MPRDEERDGRSGCSGRIISGGALMTASQKKARELFCRGLVDD